MNEPFNPEEKVWVAHAGHLLMEKRQGDVVELVAIGGPVSGKVLRRFGSRDELNLFAKAEGISFRTREGT